MEKEDKNTMNLLENQYHVIRCNSRETDTVHANHVNAEQKPLQCFDSSKEALLRLISTTNDPEEDIYTATAGKDLSELAPEEINKTDERSDSSEKCDEASDVQNQNEETSNSVDTFSDTTSNNNITTNKAIKTDLASTNLTNKVDFTTSATGNTSSGDECQLSKHQDIVNTISDKNKDGESHKGFVQGSQNVECVEFATSHSNVSSDNSEVQMQKSNSPNVGPCYDESVLDPNVEMPIESQSPPSELACDNEDTPSSVSEKLDILKYAKSEWKGTTHKAECLRQGYIKITEETNCEFMRKIRGDNYCAFRAAAFQILTQNTQVLSSYPNWQNHILNLPERLTQNHACGWLSQWTFADRLPSGTENRILIMKECLAYFIEQKQLSETMENNSDRQAYFLALFNSGTVHEIKVFEAMKLMMLETAVSLYDANLNGDPVPVFAWLLFARDTSENPYNLMINHLNPAGKTGGLEQVEMCLLGQALEVTVQVFRPSNVEQEDFVTYYPDHMVASWEKIKLIAEDDRHYNIVIS